MNLQPLGIAIAVLLLVGSAAPLYGTAASQSRLLDERSFRLEKNGRDQVLLEIVEAGILVVKVQVKKPLATLPLHLLLEGPGGLRIEKQDSAPLRLRYPIDKAQAGTTWRVSVTSVGNLGPVTGKLTIELQPGIVSKEGPTSGKQVSRAQITDGSVTVVNDQLIRASCRDKNTDVFVRLDMERGSGTLFMSFNPVFALAASYASATVIEMRGNGERPLNLDLDRRILYFASGEEATFCRVRVFLGEGG